MKRVFSFALIAVALCAAPFFAEGQGKGVGVKGAGKVKDVGQSQSSNKEPKTVDLGSRIESNTALAAKLKPLLPEGATLSQASSGFKNQGQFIAALHVSQNLNIPFDQLKAKMTGTESMSLGAAIHAAKPELSQVKANEEAKKAEKEAKETERTDKK